ncbi:carboxymuconolactone decarboxylase family protein [Phenylobacterium immobile]|uniref:carboxymuconolactone decarboxylase family protein n=1 Tax=Phenylobacterium immobile TaxID=21 RepID=UPI000B13FFEB|nr:carboxymuconolactone decarboxylase family protein [Phenylobacterium immobile]
MTNTPPRYAPAAYEALSDAQRGVYDRIVAGPRGKVLAPHHLLLASPILADQAQEMGAFLRYGSALSPALSELAIMIAAHRWGCAYEWGHHRPIAVAAGVPDACLVDLEADRQPIFPAADQALIYETVRALMKDGRLDDDQFAAAKATLGDRGLGDLVGIVGYYSMLAMLLNAYETPAEA